MLDEVADLSDCYNVNDADENILGEDENIQPNNNSENLLVSYSTHYYLHIFFYNFLK